MDTLVLIMIILVVVFGVGGIFTTRSSYSGAYSGMGNILYTIAALALIILALRLLGIF